MNDSLVPESLDARKIFHRNAVVQGRWPVSRMTRLSGLLADDSGYVDVDLLFALDAEHRKSVSGTIEAQLNVYCQRCLDTMPLTISEKVALAVVASEAIGLRLPEQIDPWISEDDVLSLPDMLEDQLILGLPIVSKHSEGECDPEIMAALQDDEQGTETGAADETTGTVEDKDNPFAVLASLKKTKD